VLLISFLSKKQSSNVANQDEYLSESKIFIQMVYLHYEGEGEEGTNPMELSREFTEKFSEIFLEGSMADFLEMNESSR